MHDMHTEFWSGSLKEKRRSEDGGLDRRTTCKWILKNRI